MQQEIRDLKMSRKAIEQDDQSTAQGHNVETILTREKQKPKEALRIADNARATNEGKVQNLEKNIVQLQAR